MGAAPVCISDDIQSARDRVSLMARYGSEGLMACAAAMATCTVPMIGSANDDRRRESAEVRSLELRRVGVAQFGIYFVSGGEGKQWRSMAAKSCLNYVELCR